MATITNKNIVDDIIAGDGYYEGDPRVVKIVEYENQWNHAPAWGVVYEIDRDKDRYEHGEACLNPRVIWEART